MSVPVEVPTLGESVTEAIVAEWLKKEGEYVAEDEVIVELETDKISVSVPAPVSGTITSLKAEIDDTVEPGDVIAEIEPGEQKAEEAKAPEKAEAKAPEAAKAPEKAPEKAEAAEKVEAVELPADLSPAVRRLVEENNVDVAQVEGTGPGGRITKGDVLSFVEARGKKPSAPAKAPARAPAPVVIGEEPEERVRMSKLRQTIAKRLVEAQHNAAMLTTFNDVDMSAVMALRGKYKDMFADKYGIKLGFMSFFVKACIEGLKAFPAVNAEIDGTELVYKNFYHIGVAVGGGRGLVVPVIRNADRISFAQTEQTIRELAQKAVKNQLSMEELQGGTFTITNGGIYGSMLSTPILNPPQSGILGMHRIEERPVAVNGKVEIRPMMYLALTYDHRVVDGREAVSFLKRVKECIEDPERILLEI